MHRRTFLGFVATGVASMAFAQESSPADIFLDPKEVPIFEAARERLRNVNRHVGFGNFNIIDFDLVLHYARNVSSIGAFTPAEMALMEKLFYETPEPYGFFGRRTCDSLTQSIDEKEVYKVPRSGHYLFKGEPLEAFERLQKDVGPTLILTSGVRSVPKQMDLFLNRIHRCEGNISLATKTIAPPAHSYHSIGDFDVGKEGFGYLNFTEEFAKTEEFQRLQELPYVRTRYTPGNPDGVWFEPWHIQIIEKA